MTDIAMLVHNRERITFESITEIKRRTTTPHRLIVYDNGSDRGTIEMMIGLQNRGYIDLLVLGDENKGVHWGHNALLDRVSSDDLYVSTDNDIIPQSPVDGRDWLAILLGLMDRHPDYAAISCRPHAMIGDSAAKMFADAPSVVERGFVGAVLRIMRTNAVKATGGWKDKIEPSRNNEERWICGRLKSAGWRVGYSRDVRAIHLWGEPDKGEDPWGYDGNLKPSDHGHREVWPPPDRFGWRRLGVDWESCR